MGVPYGLRWEGKGHMWVFHMGTFLRRVNTKNLLTIVI